jgi:hypothetical protein
MASKQHNYSKPLRVVYGVITNVGRAATPTKTWDLFVT